MNAKTGFVFMLTCLFWISGLAQVSISTDGSPPDASSMLDVKSATKGILIPRLTTTQRDAISSPVIGLVIFNITTDCIEIYNLSGWWNICTSHSLPAGVTPIPSSTALCAGSTLTLTGSAIGATFWNWTGPNGFISSLQSPSITNITTAAAGVYTLTARNAAGSSAPVLTPSVTIDQTVPGAAGTVTGTSNVVQGQNVVSYSIAAVSRATGYTWNYTGTGFTIGSGENTNSITANFSGSATSGSIVVTPTNSCGNGTASPSYPITVDLFNLCGTYTYGTVVAASYTWLDRNLGASRVATATDDYQAYGSLYQWGRRSDGHQCITWTASNTGIPLNPTTSTQCSLGTCSNALFVTRNTSTYDWNIPESDILWMGALKGTNDPCPTG
jgi:hypothetical protein